MSDIIVMYDTVTIDTVPPNPPAVAGYVGGSWPTFSPLVKKFPKALHKSIAVSFDEDADILDIENGDAVPGQAPVWWSRQRSRGLPTPGFYADFSTMPAVKAALTSAKIARADYVLWVAWLDGTSAIPAGYDARQWTFTALGRNLDQSACLPGFFGPTVAVVNKMHYERFTGVYPWGTRRLDERQTVLDYDGARQHTVRYFLYLRQLREELKWLADRVAFEAQSHPYKNGRPDWASFDRGWRFQQLIHRAQGVRFA